MEKWFKTLSTRELTVWIRNMDSSFSRFFNTDEDKANVKLAKQVLATRRHNGTSYKVVDGKLVFVSGDNILKDLETKEKRQKVYSDAVKVLKGKGGKKNEKRK